MASDTSALATREVFAFPASFAQQRLWFVQQLEPAGTAYVVQAPFRVTGPLDAATLERTLNEIVRRHESLRTTFALIDGEPMQLVAPSLTLPLRVVDVSHLPAAEREREVERLARDEARRPFDLEHGPLLRATLLRAAPDDHVLVLAMHHIVSDGWSVGVLVREASALYDAFLAGHPSPLDELPIQYADYSVWQREHLQGDVLEEQLAYWRRRLGGAPQGLDLPTDRPRAPLQLRRGAQQALRIEPEAANALRALVRAHGATLFMGLLAAYEALLYRYTGQHDLCVGVPIAGRTRSETDALIGFFVNTLVLRADVSGSPDFAELLRRVKETTLEAYAYQDVPFEKLVEVLAPERDVTRTPLFETMFSMQSAPMPEFALGAAHVAMLASDSGGAKFALTLSLREAADGALDGYLEYDAGLFDAATIARMADHYSRLLTGMIAAPSAPVSRVPMLSDAERRQLAAGCDDPHASAESPVCAHELFERQAARIPHAVAVAGVNGRLTYAELNARANRLARYLRERGAGPETRVGLLVEPSLEMAAGVLGVLKAGAAYVPIDPGFPPERIGYIVEHSGIRIALTTRALRGMLATSGAAVVELDESVFDAYDAGDLPHVAAPENAAYAIYTSGSTGRPKGVVVEHRQLSNYVHAIARRFELRAGLSYAMLQPLAVDACNTVLFPALCGGGTLHVMPRDRAADPFALAEYFGREPVDVLKIAPSHLAALLDACPSPALMPRHTLALGGEGSRWDWLRRVVAARARPGSRVFIHYGPTEATVGMLTHRIEPGASSRDALAPVGSPLANTRAYVLGPGMELAPPGVRGEIFIGGACVARGYLDRPDLTAERFVPDPFGAVPGARLYRTGDLARRAAEGWIEFLGRTDHQVKIRGFRVELGEIESALLEHPHVHRAVAIAREDGSGDKRIVAYVTGEGAGAPADRTALAAELRRSLARRFPAYMVPAAVVVLDAMPFTAQGKVDLRALPAPAAAEPARAHEPQAPLTPAEARVAGVWSEVLGVQPRAAGDDFFQLGGHSLLAVRMLAMIHERFGERVSLAAFLSAPNVASLARHATEPGEASPHRIIVELQRGRDVQPFFCVHPVGGDAVCYLELAAALGPERPFYAFHAPSDRASYTVEDLAETYLAEMRRIAPRGPYALGGWSLGGLIAFEMVRRLEAAGEHANLLAMFDTYVPPRNRPGAAEESTPLLVRFGTYLARMLEIDTARAGPAFLGMSPDEQRQPLIDVLRAHGLIDQASDRAFDEMLERFARNAVAADRYELQPVRRRIDLFVAGEGEAPHALASSWSAWTQEGVDAHVVSGDHYSMLRRPNVGGLAARLGARFAEPTTGRRMKEDAMIETESGSLTPIRRYLDDAMYALVDFRLSLEAPPGPSGFPKFEQLEGVALRLDEPPRTLFRLLRLGLTVDDETVSASVPAAVLDGLVRAGVLERVEGAAWRTRGLLLIPIGGALVFVSVPPSYPTASQPCDVWFDLSSYVVAQSLPGALQGERVLDVCSGSGVQSVLCALRGAASVTGLELSERAVEIARLNALLNGVADRVDFRVSDKLGALHDGERFDFVVCNTPYAPVIGDDVPASAGALGNSVLFGMLDQLPERLSERGHGVLATWRSAGARGSTPQREHIAARLAEAGCATLAFVDRAPDGVEGVLRALRSDAAERFGAERADALTARARELLSAANGAVDGTYNQIVTFRKGTIDAARGSAMVRLAAPQG